MNSQRLLPHEHKPHQVYVLYDRSGSVLYVGVSSQVRQRIATHVRSQPWREEIDQGRTWTSDAMAWEDALAVEQALIQKLRPKHNKRQRNGALYVATGARDVVAAETRLKRAASTGDPAAVAAYREWQDEQRREADRLARTTDFSALFPDYLDRTA